MPALEVTKAPAKPSVAAGEGDSYDIRIHNAGGASARDVLVADTLPKGMTYTAETASASPSTGFSEISDSGSAASWSIASITAGATVEITVPVGTEATLASGAELTNSVAVSSVEEPTAVHASGAIDITTSADVSAEKRVLGTGSAVPGQELSFEVSATNHGPSVAREVKLVDKLPAGVSYVNSTPECVQSAEEVKCTAGDLAPNQRASFEIVTSVAPGLTEAFRNAVLAESPTYDPEPKNNEASVEVTPHPAADLSLLKTALTPAVTDGSDAVFDLTATNHGPSDAAEAEIIDTLPAGLGYVSASGATCSAKGQEVSCPLGGLAVGAQATVELTTRTSGPGDRVNTAEVTSATEDPEPLNNHSEAEVEVAPAADLQITKTAVPTDAKVGGEVTYTLVVTNNGPDAAKSARLSDELPAGETYVSNDNEGGCTDTGQQVTCPLGELINGATRTIQLVVLVGVSLGERDVINTAQVSSETFDPDLANNSSSAAIHTGPTADVALEKTGPASVLSGAQITWSLMVRNNGPSTAHEVTLEDQLPSGVTLTGTTPSQGEACQDSNGMLTCDLGTMADGAQAEVEVSATVNLASGLLQNTARVHATEPDPEEANNTSTAATIVTAAPTTPAVTGAGTSASPRASVESNGAAKSRTRVRLRKLVNRSVAHAGELLTYRLIVSDIGNETALALQVCDAIPAQTTVVSVDGGRLGGGHICYRLSSLNPGRARAFKIVLRIDANADGTIGNRATASGANFTIVHARASTRVKGSVAARRESAVTG